MKCKHCLKEFRQYDSLNAYCSYFCKLKSKNPKERGRTDNRKLADFSDPVYRKAKFEKIRRIMSKHGRLICEHCGTYKVIGFECHHIIFRSEKPNHPNLHNQRNLLMTCLKQEGGCHSDFHNNKPMRNPYIKERKLDELFDDDKLMNIAAGLYNSEIK